VLFSSFAVRLRLLFGAKSLVNYFYACGAEVYSSEGRIVAIDWIRGLRLKVIVIILNLWNPNLVWLRSLSAQAVLSCTCSYTTDWAS
jgi:hypothetical protein